MSKAQYRINWTSIILSCLIFLFVPMLSNAQAETTLKIALREDLPPYSYRNAEGKPVGLFVDLWQAAAKKGGFKVDIVLTTAEQSLDYLKQGKVDALGAVFLGAEGSVQAALSRPYYSLRVGLFGRQDSDLKGLMETFLMESERIPLRAVFSRSFRLGVVKDSIENQSSADKRHSLEHVYYADLKQLIYALREGKIDGFLAPIQSVNCLLTQLGFRGEISVYRGNSFIRWVYASTPKEDKELLKRINSAFLSLTESDIHSIENRWISDKKDLYSKSLGITLTDAERAWIEQNPSVSFGMLNLFPPFSFTDKEGKNVGLALDYLDLISQITGIDFVIKERGNFEKLVPLLKSRDLSGLVYNVKTKEREEYLDFTKPYLTVNWVVVTRKEHPAINSINQLAGKKIGVIKGSATWEKFKDRPDIQLFVYDNQDSLWNSLSFGEVDAVIQNLASASYHISTLKLTNLKVAYTMDDIFQISISLIKGQPELLSILNKAIDAIPEEYHAKIKRKWLYVQIDDSGKWLDMVLKISYFALFIFSAFALSLFWNRRLARKVSARKKAEQSLGQERQNLQTIIDAEPVTVIIIDKDLKVIKTNTQGQWLFKCPVKECNLRFGQLINCANRNLHPKGCSYSEQCLLCPLTNALKRLFQNGEPTTGGEMLSIIDNEGVREERWYKFNISQITLDEEVYAVATLDDITDRKAMERDLIIAKEDAEQATEAKANFLSNMSHEIRTPLNAIININNILLESQLTEEQREWSRLSLKSSEMLLNIINDILDLSKIEAGRMQLEARRFNLPDSLSNIIKMMKVTAEQKGITLTLELSDELPAYLLGDPIRLQQVLVNLIGNAIKFTNEGGVTVKVCREAIETGQREIVLRFTVMDTGIGIPREKLSGIFEPFTQAERTTTRRYGGTGLGLTISKRIVELMGGEIGVDSELGKGATCWFTARFSTTEDQSDMVKDEATPEEQQDIQRGLKILLAEDNSINQFVIRELLKKIDADIDIASSGTEAVEMAKARLYDLILMDIQMPEMDGIEASSIIRSLPEPHGKVPIIALSAFTERQYTDKVLSVGVNAYVFKPIDKKTLFKTIKDTLDQN